ncbi:MAG TPA: Orn/Lys/Arg decarboxylase N-terminal domain-containing protein, partial [Gemmatimonadales bacterium]|nr:Orn/Lys/Arg decarboxylase N-terminal domain-containing protein [Gemmatimonadales bacterium]
MIERRIKRIQLRALMVDDELPTPTAEGHAARTLVQELQGRAIDVVEAPSAEDGMSVVASDSAIHALLLDWSLGSNGERAHDKARALLEFVRSRNDKIPIFLMAEQGEASSIPIDVMEMVDEYVWTLEDTAAFVGGRVVAAMRRYIEVMMPPLAAAVMKFSQEYEYSWHTPGHTGGTAFLKSPVGRMFFDYFGENLLRSDLSISVGALGSLLDHTGPMGAHEKYAARVFGAHRTYSVTNGTSMSNRVIFMAAVARDQIALCDRNCHKSIEHSLVMTGAIPTYLVPVRNRYGIIGPILPERLKPEAIKAAIKANPLVTKGIDPRPVHSIVTNSTYDGLCYNARRVTELLDPSVDRIHFDEAWYAYARFNPLYRDRHAMYGDPKDYTKGPTIFATHSTHKLLAALSQASFLHIRDGRRPIPHARFNESYMLHA